jgi:hypothetical protein
MPISNKDRYRQLCQENDIPLFMQAWWMDAVCCEGKEWDVFLYEKKGRILAAMPYHLFRKVGFKLIIQPQLTQYNGLWIDYPDNIASYQKYSLEKEVMNYFIDQLDQLSIDGFNQNFHYSVTNWQPFFWKGFKQTTRYTYLIENISDSESIYNHFCPRSKQKHILRASDLIFDLNFSEEEFYDLHKQSLKSNNQTISYSEDLFFNIVKAAKARKQAQIFAVRDKLNNVHAALFVVWDARSAYNLIVARNSKFNSSGGSVLLVWEVLKYLKDKTETYDFEGSMIEGVAYNNELFGAIQKPYFVIQKSNSILFSLLMFLKNKLWK